MHGATIKVITKCYPAVVSNSEYTYVFLFSGREKAGPLGGSVTFCLARLRM